MEIFVLIFSVVGGLVVPIILVLGFLYLGKILKNNNGGASQR